MTLYDSGTLNITYNSAIDCFIQNWKEPSIESKALFRSEMLSYTEFYKQYKPKNTLWIQTNFHLELSEDDYQWVEQNVNIPCLAYGNQKTAFVVGRHLFTHAEIMESFPKINSCIQPKHFFSYEQAINWIKGNKTELNNELSVEYSGTDHNGDLVFKVSANEEKAPLILSQLNQLKTDELFFAEKHSQFQSLTEKEKEVIKLFVQGIKVKEIAHVLEISVFTARTHWRNIKRKLKLTNTDDLHSYHRIFMH